MFLAALKILNDADLNEEAKIKAIQDINDKLETIVASVDYATFLETAIPLFLKILQEESIDYVSESLEQQKRKTLLEILYRLPSNDHLRPYIRHMLATMFSLLPKENENNALNMIKIILELLKQYRPSILNEIPQFLTFLVNKINLLASEYLNLFEKKVPNKFNSLSKDSLLEIIKKIYHPLNITIESSTSENLNEQYTILPKSYMSLKVLSELPIIVVIIYQLYKPAIHTDVGAMIPNMINFICLEPPFLSILNQSSQEILCEFITAQVKILSFIAYVIRPFQEPINTFATQLVRGIILLLKNCPPELANMRKEILIALRHIQATHLRTKFVPHLHEILDQKLLLGKSITCYDTLCPLAYSSLADMIHHLRQNLTLSQLVCAISVFSKNIQDDILPWSIQNVSCKLLLNLVECVKIRAETENDPHGRYILVKILKVFVLKFESIAKVKIPEIKRSFKDSTEPSDSKDMLSKSAKSIYTPSQSTMATLCSLANDIKILVKTLTTGIKTVTWGILTCKVGISSYAHQNKLLLPPEIRLYAAFVEYALSVFEIYTAFNTTSPELFQKTLHQKLMENGSPNKACFNTSNQQLTNKDEKENLDTFVGVFLMLNPMSFYEIFEPLAPSLVDVVLKNNNIIIIFNCFLASSTTSPPFTNIILNHLLKNMADLGNNKDKANLFLKIFKLIFGSVSYISTENELILKQQLAFIVNNCLTLSMEAKEPFNFFLLLRYLFRFIGNGAHDSLYQEFLPLLPSLLQNLNAFQCDEHKTVLKDLFIELCLTVPVRLSSLLPHLPLLMDPLVAALNGSVNLVSQGLRTLELCVDNLQPDFLHEHLNPVRGRLMKSLWDLMRSSNSDSVTHSAFRLLGKFGGINRKALKSSQEFSSYDALDGPGSSFCVKFINNQKSITLPFGKIIETAYDSLEVSTDSTECKNAWQVISAFLALNISTENDDMIKLFHLMTHASFKDRPLLQTYPHKYKCWDEKARYIHKKALAGVFIAATCKDLSDQVNPFMLSLVRHYTFVALSQQAGLFANIGADTRSTTTTQKLTVFAPENTLEENGFGRGMEPEILIDALIHVLSNANKDFCKPVIRAIFLSIATAAYTLGSYRRVFEMPFFQYLSQQIVSLCYASSWFGKKGGCVGINILILRTDSLWLWNHHAEYLKALFFVIMDLTNEVSNGTVILAQNILEKMISQLMSLPQDDLFKTKILHSMTKEFIQRISSPISLVRKEAMKCVRLVSEIANKSIYELTLCVKEIIYEIIPPKKHLLRHQSVNSQLGLMEALTFCSETSPPIFTLDLNVMEHRVFFTELISLCEAEDALLLRLPCYKNLNNDITNLRKTALKTLIACQHVTQYQEKIFNILFKNLNSSNSEIQQTSFESLSKFAGLHLVDMETVHHSIRSLLLMLGDYRNLTPNFLTRLLHFAKLFPNTFNEKFCEHLLAHMITLLKVLSSKTGVKTLSQELKVCNEIIKIFCALPNAAATILEPLCQQILSLEPIFVNEIMIDLRHDLHAYLCLYPKETIAFFTTPAHMQQPLYYNFFLVMLEVAQRNSLLDYLKGNVGIIQSIINEKAQVILSHKDWYTDRMNLNEEYGENSDDILSPLYTSLKILCIIQDKAEQGIDRLKEIIVILRLLWNSKNFQSAYYSNEAFNNGYWEIPKFVVHILLAFFKKNRKEIHLLFEMIVVFKNKYMESVDEFKSFITQELVIYPVGWKRQLFLTFFEAYNDSHFSDKMKAAIFQHLIIPIYYDSFYKGQTDQIIGQGNLGAPVDMLFEPSKMEEYNLFRIFVDRFITNENFFVLYSQDETAPAKSPISNELKVALLQFACLLVQYYSRAQLFVTSNDAKKQNTFLRKMVTFAWPCLQNQNCMDPSVKYHGHLLLAHIVDKFTIHKRIVIQVFHSLLKASSSEAKNVIKKALEILVPAIPIRVENGLTMLTYWTKKILLEEGHTLNQLAHILQLISANRDIYYPARHSLVHLMLSAMSKLGLSGSNTTENRKLVIETAEVIIEWDIKTEALAPPPLPTSQSVKIESIVDEGDGELEKLGDGVNNTAPAEVRATALSIQASSLSQMGSICSPVPSIFSAEQHKTFSLSVTENVVNLLIRIVCPVGDLISPAQTTAAEYISNKCNELLSKAMKIPGWRHVQLKLSWLDKMLTPLENALNPSNNAVVSNAADNVQATASSTTQQVAHLKINVTAVCGVLDTLSLVVPLLNNNSPHPDPSSHPIIPQEVCVALCEKMAFKQVSRTLNWCLDHSMPPPSVSDFTGEPAESAAGVSSQAVIFFKNYGLRLGRCVRSLVRVIMLRIPPRSLTNFSVDVQALQQFPAAGNNEALGHYLELKAFYGHLVRVVGDYLNSFEKFHGVNIPILYHILSILGSYCMDDAPYLDQYITPFTRILQKVVKDHINACGVSNSAPAVVSDPGSASSLPEVTIIDVIIQCLDLVKYRVSIMSTEMRKNFIGNLFIGLIEKTTDVKLLEYIIELIQDWLQNKGGSAEQAPSLREKSIILVKLTHCIEKRFAENALLNNKFLELILIVYRDDSLRTSELTTKLESAYLSGLKSNNVEIREKFFVHLNKNMGNTVYDRINYIISSQNWEAMGSHFWIKQCVQIIMMLAEPMGRLKNGSPSVALPNVTSVFQDSSLNGLSDLEKDEFLTKISGDKMGDLLMDITNLSADDGLIQLFLYDEDIGSDISSAFSTISSDNYDGLDVETLIEKYGEYMHHSVEKDVPQAIKDEISPVKSMPSDVCHGESRFKLNQCLTQEIKFVSKLKNGASQVAFLSALVYFCHSSTPLSEWLWINLLPKLYDLIPSTLQKEELEREYQLFFLSGSHIQQKDCHPSVINVFFEAFARCHPSLYIQPTTIRYLGKAHNLWHRAILTLEKMYSDQSLSPDVPIGGVGQRAVRQIEEDTFEFIPENTLEPDTPKKLLAETQAGLSDIYTVLGENDMLYSLWERGSKFPQTSLGLLYENLGQFLNAVLCFENMTERGKAELTNATGSDVELFDHVEFGLWENNWVSCLKELNEWDLLNNFATSTPKNYNPQIVLDCAWKTSDWNSMKEALTTVQKSCPRELAWKVNLCAGYLALSQSDDHHLNMMDRIVEIATGLAAREWKRLPFIITQGSHGSILQATQKVVELQEAAQLHITLHYYQSQQQSFTGFQTTPNSNHLVNSFDNTLGNMYLGNGDLSINNGNFTHMSGLLTSNYSPTTSSIPSINMSEMRSIIKTWKNRFPIVSDSFAYWHDIFSWRQQQYQYITTLFDASNQSYHTGGGDSISSNNPSLLATHSAAQGLVRLATSARKQKLPLVALEILNKVSADTSIPIADCFRKVRQSIKCHLELYNMSVIDGEPDLDIITNNLYLMDDINVKYFTKDMISEIMAYRGHCYHLLENTEEANKAFSGAVQLSDSHVKAWGMWGEFLADTFWQSISQCAHATNINPYNKRTAQLINVARSALTCLLQGCRHSNEIKVARYISQILWLLKFDDEKCTLSEMVDKYLTTIPSYHWLMWVPQLLMALERKDGYPIGRYVMNIITHVGRTYPQAIFFPVRTTFLSLKMELKENTTTSTGMGLSNNNNGGGVVLTPKESTPTTLTSILPINVSTVVGVNEAEVFESVGNGNNKRDAQIHHDTVGDMETDSERVAYTPSEDMMEGKEGISGEPVHLSFMNISITEDDKLTPNTFPQISMKDSEVVITNYIKSQQTAVITSMNDTFQANSGMVDTTLEVTSTPSTPSLNLSLNANHNSKGPPTPGTPSGNIFTPSSSIANQSAAVAAASSSTSPILWCRRILHILRELHPTTLYTLEGLVDQLIWFRETWFEELLQYLKQLRSKCYIILFQEYKLIIRMDMYQNCPDQNDENSRSLPNPQPPLIPYGECSADLDTDAILTYLISIMNKLLTTFESGIENLANLASKLTTSSTESSIRRAQATLKDPMFVTLKAQFLEDFSFVRDKFSLVQVEVLLEKLRSWINLLENKIILDLPKSYLMDDKCSLLNNWLLNDVEIELPGETNYAKPSQYSVKICQFSPLIRVETKCGYESCRKISLRGSDGKNYSYLVLNDNLFLSPIHSHTLKPWEKRSSSHLRMVTTQIMRYLNVAFEKNKETLRRDLFFRLPRMVTISPHMTLVETDDSIISLKDIFKHHCVKNKVPPETPILRYYAALDRFDDNNILSLESKDVQTFKTAGSQFVQGIFRDIQSQWVPRCILKDWAQSTFISPTFASILNSTDYWIFRKTLATDAATLATYDYVFRTFPVGPDSITYYRTSNSVLSVPFSLQIDLGQLLSQSFADEDEEMLAERDSPAGKDSNRPRPLFRITPNYAEFLGEGLLDGPYHFCVRAIARCASDSKLRLDSMLRAYLIDLPALNYNYEEVDKSPLPCSMDCVGSSINPSYINQNILTLVESLNLINLSVTANLKDFAALSPDFASHDILKIIIDESKKVENLSLVNPILYPWL